MYRLFWVFVIRIYHDEHFNMSMLSIHLNFQFKLQIEGFLPYNIRFMIRYVVQVYYFQAYA